MSEQVGSFKKRGQNSQKKFEEDFENLRNF